jgi:hypothetical protein
MILSTVEDVSDAVRGHLLVVAKSPAPGRVKTRLCPPLTPQLAAKVAEAALRDTLESVSQARPQRRVLALDGQPDSWLPAGFRVIPQIGGDLSDRLEAAWACAGAPGLQIGMDTPQVTAELLNESLSSLVDAQVDAVLGPAEDGGWWAVGFNQPQLGAFRGVPMGIDSTYERQLSRLRAMGLRVHILPTLRDLDTASDAVAIAQAYPTLRTARAVRDALTVAGAK